MRVASIFKRYSNKYTLIQHYHPTSKFLNNCILKYHHYSTTTTTTTTTNTNTTTKSNANEPNSTTFDITSKPKFNGDETDITQLDNGIRVVSDAVPGHFAAFGVYIAAGSRYETSSFSGVSHMLERIAFKSTQNLDSDKIQSIVEALGGNLMAQASREIIQYQGTVYHQDLDTIASLFAEMVQRPLLLQDEIDELKLSTSYEIESILSNPDLYLPELLHSVAYQDQTLGKPFLCDATRLYEMDANNIRAYMNKVISPENIVIAVSGVPHIQAVELAQRYFGQLNKADSSKTLNSNSQIDSNKSEAPLTQWTKKLFKSKPEEFIPDFNKAKYVGGVKLEAKDDVEFTQVHVALEGVPLTADDLYPLATLQALMGGGSSFSAGGPGKGMHSRLYRTVLNQYGWSQSCQAFNHSYRDSGLFGIAGACIPDYTLDMLHVIGYSLASVTEPRRIATQELERAKHQLKNNLLMNLESRLVRLEDLGQQVLISGIRTSPETVCQRIERLTARDVAGVAQRLFSGPSTNPTVIGYGRNVETLNAATEVLSKFGIGARR